MVIENNNKCKDCIFFVVPGDGDMLLGIQDIELLNILQINCKTIGTKIGETGTNYNEDKGMPSIWEVNSTIQIQAQKRIVIRRTMVQETYSLHKHRQQFRFKQ